MKKNQTAASILKRPAWLSFVGIAVLVLVIIYVILGVYWSRPPDFFWVNRSVDENRAVIGYATTDTLIRVAETMLDKPGGYLNNDKFPPGVLMDNTPNWEIGVLQQVRDLARVCLLYTSPSPRDA